MYLGILDFYRGAESDKLHACRRRTMPTSDTFAHRNLCQRVERLLATTENPTPWQLNLLSEVVSDLEFGRYHKARRSLDMAERPDRFDFKCYKVWPATKSRDLLARLVALAAHGERFQG